VSKKRNLVDRPPTDLAQEAINDETMNADSQVGNFFLLYSFCIKLNLSLFHITDCGSPTRGFIKLKTKQH
jgi:hypothetical protein